MGVSTRCHITFCLLVALIGACSSDSDGAASEELRAAISKTADQAVSMLAAQSETLGATPLETPLAGELGPFVDALEATGNLFLTAAENIDSDTNTFVYVGLDYALFKAIQAPTRKAPAGARLSGPQRLDDLFESADQEKVRELGAGDLAEEVRRFLRPLAPATLLGNPELVRRLLPPGSPEASRFAAWVEYDGEDNPTVTVPQRSLVEESVNDPTSWNGFVNAVVAETRVEGSEFGEVLEKLSEDIERLDFQTGD